MMEQFFTKDYSGAPFELFNLPHLTALGVILAICLSFLYFRKIWDEPARRKVRYGLAVFILIAELSWHWWVLTYDQWTLQRMLPLHLCSIFIWLSVVLLINKNYTIYQLHYFLGLGGAIQALLTPDAGIYGFPHFRAIQTFADHGGIVISAMFMTLVEGFRPTWKSFRPVILWSNLFMVFVLFVNLLIGSNYMYLAGKPDFPTLLDILAPWPWYILQLEFIGLSMAVILYLPFVLKDWLATRKVIPA